VQRRSWPLIALVLAVGALLAVAPFLFVYERSPYAEALDAYDAMCAARASGDLPSFRVRVASATAAVNDLFAGFHCVDRASATTAFGPVLDSDPQAGNAWWLTVTPRSGGAALKMRFVREGERVVWSP
jgi:hypothetical protein